MSEQRIIVTELEYVTTTKDEYDALRAENAELKRQLQEAKEFLAAIHMTEEREKP
jgi:hypothetical protein